MAADQRSHRRFRELRARLLAQAQADHANGLPVTCWLCLEPLDPWQPYNGGRNPLAPTVEHVKPLAHGGALMGTNASALAHKGCQSAQGGRIAAERRRPPVQWNSRRW